MRTNVPLSMRALRTERRWRQSDLAARARRSRDAVSRVERAYLAGVTIGTLNNLVEALGATLVVEMRWQGADLGRLVDRAHAQLVERTSRRLTSAGWMTRPEVSFNHFGDRGSCDLIAWHPATRTMLIVEAKTRLGDLQDTLHRLDVKVRVAPILAVGQGWPEPACVARALVLAEERTNRRVLERHAAVFGAFGARGWAAYRWLRRPSGARASLVWFEVLSDSDKGRTISADRVSIRHAAG